MIEHAGDIFDPSRYAKVRLPLHEAETLPPLAYTSEAFYRREVETIFTRSWYAVGRVERVPEPGDYFSADVTGIPIVVVRGLDGKLRALSNS